MIYCLRCLIAQGFIFILLTQFKFPPYLGSLPLTFQVELVPLFSVLTKASVTYMNHNKNVKLFLSPLLLENSFRNLSTVLCSKIWLTAEDHPSLYDLDKIHRCFPFSFVMKSQTLSVFFFFSFFLQKRWAELYVFIDQSKQSACK